MKVVRVSSTAAGIGRLGPLCIACGNTRRFWVHTPSGNELCELAELPDGEARVVACGRCRSRNSIVISRLD